MIRLEAVWQVRLVRAWGSPHKNWVRLAKRQRAPAARRKLVTEKAAASCSFGLLSCSKSIYPQLVMAAGNSSLFLEAPSVGRRLTAR
jgi:hypothetical protein